jgi:hypothetical protein
VSIRLVSLSLSVVLFLSQFSYADPVRLNDDEGLTGKFSLSRFLTGFERPILSEGKFFLIPKVGLVWQTETPFKMRMDIDDEGINQSLEGEEISRISNSRFPALIFLRDVLENSLSGNWEPLENLAGSTLEKQSSGWRLNYSISESRQDLPFKTLVFDISDFVDLVTITKEGGDKDVIRFFDQRVESKEAIRLSAEMNRKTKP